MNPHAAVKVSIISQPPVFLNLHASMERAIQLIKTDAAPRNRTTKN